MRGIVVYGKEMVCTVIAHFRQTHKRGEDLIFVHEIGIQLVFTYRSRIKIIAFIIENFRYDKRTYLEHAVAEKIPFVFLHLLSCGCRSHQSVVLYPPRENVRLRARHPVVD